jgi:hypothetical protein
VVPVGSGAEYGFISLLRVNLSQKLIPFVSPSVTVWRDKEDIDEGEQFTPKIREAINNSQLMVVVLTDAWLASSYCQDELATFTARWTAGPTLKDRFIVVLPTWLDPSLWPAALRGQTGYRFYTSENERDGAPEVPMYRSDGKPTPPFYDVVTKMADFTHKRAASGAVAAVQSAQRTVYVAQTPSDMENQYRKVVAELATEGYNVVPDPDGRIPDSKGASDYVRAAMAQADVSIHLLGESAGVRDRSDPIVALQLELAAQRAESAQAFCRIIFAPKVFVDDEDPDNTKADRDPIAVRERFGRALPTDTVIGDGISDFLVEAKRILKASTPRPVVEKPLKKGAKVFVDFHPSDGQYAAAVAKALRERGVSSRFAAVDDDNMQNKLTNAGLLKDADAVIYCWANATDAWLYAEAADFDDWRKFGRTEAFRTRAAIVGPPDRISKKLYSNDDPPESIDKFVDLSAYPQPTPDKLDPLIDEIPPE